MVIKVCYFYPTGLTNIIFESQNLEKERKLGTSSVTSKHIKGKVWPAIHGKRTTWKKSFPATAEKWGVILGGRQKSCKYCFNESLRLAYSSMCCRSNVSYSCLHTHWSEVIPLLSHPKGGQAGQKILHFRQQSENFFPQVHILPSIYLPMNPAACVLPRHAPGSRLTLLIQRMPGSWGGWWWGEWMAETSQAPIQILPASPFATVRGRLLG